MEARRSEQGPHRPACLHQAVTGPRVGESFLETTCQFVSPAPHCLLPLEKLTGGKPTGRGGGGGGPVGCGKGNGWRGKIGAARLRRPLPC